MRCEWFSRRGQERAENRDVGGICRGEHFTLALIVDASCRGPRGAAFARDWAHGVLSRAVAQTRLGPDELVTVMRDSHRAIRTLYPAEMASYLALLLDAERREAWALSCGDCRLGKGLRANLRWLTPVHDLGSMAVHFTGASLDGASRRTLTRCLRGRRFEPPEVLRIEGLEGPWILATDGYWLDHVVEAVQMSRLRDDASYLRLEGGMPGVQCDSDCDNWQLFGRGVVEEAR